MNIENDNAEKAPLGLYANGEILPLFSTDISADIQDRFAKVKLTHIYYNPYDEYYIDISKVTRSDCSNVVQVMGIDVLDTEPESVVKILLNSY